MPVFLIADKRILFVHIPKTGGSAVSAALGRLGKIEFDAPFATDGTRIRPRHAHSEVIGRLLDLGGFDYIFAVVRHPVARLISEFRYQRRKSGLHLASALGFEPWLRYSLARARLDPGYRDNHFRAQSDFIVPGCEVFRHEDGLQAPMQRIAQLTGLDPREHLTRRNESSGGQVHPSARSVARIQTAYSQDFRSFNYPV